MQFDYLRYSHASRRRVVFGRRGMVCSTQPLAAQAGLGMIASGGNAIDAAVATAACLAVMEPNSCGFGGDAFALVWTGGRLYGLNASGPSPAAGDADEILRRYGDAMPHRGWMSVTVPGIPSAWAALSSRFGRMPIEETLAPAIGYAENGWPVAPLTASLWSAAADQYRDEFKSYPEHKAGAFDEWFKTFAPDGRGPRAGEIFRLTGHARTLRELAATRCESFYRGDLAQKIADFAHSTGGWLSRDDLAAFEPEWVEPIEIDYRGYKIHEIPPNGHGIVALMALGIAERFDFAPERSAKSYHRQIEAMKLAYADGSRHVADPRAMDATVDGLLSRDRLAARASLIGERAEAREADPSCGGTVYFCAADGEGNMVSFIQSTYMGFGSGLVVPGTGIALHDRGANFSLDPSHPNRYAPRKKPYHTIIPGFLTKGGEAIGPFGVMGGFMQPQGHMQVAMNMIDFGMNPQDALDAPRWQWKGGRCVEVERSFPSDLTEQLIRMGHDITIPPTDSDFGRGQIILRDECGALCGATEPRSDGTVAVL